MRTYCCAALLVLSLCIPATATTFSEIRIGDADGVGLGTGAGLTAANGGPCNLDGAGILTDGDLLPDWNGNGGTATGSGDDFDYRSAAEVNGDYVTGANFVNLGTTGSHFTDMGISTSYDSASAAGQVHIPGGLGAGGPFPKPPSNQMTNQPGFVFDFTVLKADLPAGTPMFFNLIFGDYDVSPASLRIVTVDGTVLTQSLAVQPSNKDGLIQAAFTDLDFDDVFESLDAATWHGQLIVDFIAASEPYTAFDYVELSTRPITVIPEPLTVTTALLAAAGLGGYIRRRRAA